MNFQLARSLEGRPVAQSIYCATNEWLQTCLLAGHRPPMLAVILVGDNLASRRYIAKKSHACAHVGIQTTLQVLPASTSFDQLTACIAEYNDYNGIDGILLQLPLPDQLHPMLTQILSRIDPWKDVDGLTPWQQGKLALGETDGLIPCTPKGILTLLKFYQIPLEGKQAVIINRSFLVGRPLAALLLKENCTVTLVHTKTKNLPEQVAQADLLICATGKTQWLPQAWVKKGTAIIDVGISVNSKNQLTGDVSFEAVEKKAGWISPVPGGVGPMTVASLIQNTCQCYARRLGIAYSNP